MVGPRVGQHGIATWQAPEIVDSALGTTDASSRAVASVLHEVLVDLIRKAPHLLIDLVGERVGESLGGPVRFESAEPNFSQVPNIDADLVLVVRGADGECRCVLIIEVQLRVDGRKHGSWPAYQADGHRRYGCPTYVVVIAIDPHVAAWATGTIDTGQTLFRPIVIGPREIPVIDEPTGGSVELTLLSGLAHHDEPRAVEIGAVLWQALDQADEEHGDLYWDLFLQKVSEATRRALMLSYQNYEPQSEWGKRIYAEGREAGEAEGRVAGEAEGRRAGQITALWLLLEARGLSVRDPHRARVDACPDPVQIDRWLRRAATATSIDEVFVPR